MCHRHLKRVVKEMISNMAHRIEYKAANRSALDVFCELLFSWNWQRIWFSHAICCSIRGATVIITEKSYYEEITKNLQ